MGESRYVTTDGVKTIDARGVVKQGNWKRFSDALALSSTQANTKSYD